MKAKRRSAAFLIGLTLIAAILVTGFGALGVWQVNRLAWKRDLIARVDARIHATPAPAPAHAKETDEYRRVFVTGRFLNGKVTLVRASTVRGAGYWVMTPLVTDRGHIFMINRGFVPPEAKDVYGRPEGGVRLTGLLRLSEPDGTILRENDPQTDRWYSRDVARIAIKRGLEPPVANYFIDAEAAPASSPGALPAGGLTVVRFPNNHLGYAITWFVLAVMSAGAYMFVMRQELGARRTQ